MKKLFAALLIIGMFTIISCNQAENQKNMEEQAKKDSILKIEKIKADSIANVEKAVRDSVSFAKETEQAKKIIRISKFRTSFPNSAGGVDFSISWQNKSEKVIKYANFTVEAYNAVDDIVSCEIRGNSEFTGQVTGPIKQNKWNYNDTWANAWYNSTVKKIKVKQVEIEYMDGSKTSISGKVINAILY
jgi:hypothetical protein